MVVKDGDVTMGVPALEAPQEAPKTVYTKKMECMEQKMKQMEDTAKEEGEQLEQMETRKQQELEAMSNKMQEWMDTTKQDLGQQVGTLKDEVKADQASSSAARPQDADLTIFAGKMEGMVHALKHEVGQNLIGLRTELQATVQSAQAAQQSDLKVVMSSVQALSTGMADLTQQQSQVTSSVNASVGRVEAQMAAMAKRMDSAESELGKRAKVGNNP